MHADLHSLLGLMAACLVTRVCAGSATSAPYKHVLVFSVDGMHSSDVEKYTAARPKSNMVKLLATGYEYTDAYTSAVCTESH
jgi:hypothetical protein